MSTFKTEVPLAFEKSTKNLFDPDAVRPPPSVNLVALRESFLSEAPFVSSSNRMFWRRMVDGKCFQQLLWSSFSIISDCVAENSAVDIEKLNNVSDTPLVGKMSSNLAEMYYVIKLRERELFFLRLPEVLSFMVVSAMRTSIPKHHRLCQSTRFREILLDWYCEMLGGLRFSNCRTNREWFFADLSDAPILFVTHALPPAGLARPHKLPPGVAVSKHQIALSPLINMYTGDSKARIAELAVNMTLSYSSNRPLTTLPIVPSITPGRVRQETIDYAKMRRTLKQAQVTRKKILNDHEDGVKQMHRDIRKFKVKLDKTLSALNETSAQNIIASHSLP
jgi:hypothetical protein